MINDSSRRSPAWTPVHSVCKAVVNAFMIADTPNDVNPPINLLKYLQPHLCLVGERHPPTAAVDGLPVLESTVGAVILLCYQLHEQSLATSPRLHRD